MERRALELLDLLREVDERIRTCVHTGRLEELQVPVQERGDRLSELQTALASLGTRSAGLQLRLDQFLQCDEELVSWMLEQKGDILCSLASLREGAQDPYQERFVGSAILDRRL
jgi:hypothetical protein